MTTPAPAPSPGNITPGNAEPAGTALSSSAPCHGWRAVSIVLVGAFMALLDYSVQVSTAS